MASGLSSLIRAAASSSARGSPSSWRQTSATAAALSGSSRNAGSTARARSTNNSTAGYWPSTSGGRIVVGRRGEGQDRVLALPVQVQDFTAGHEHGQGRTALEEGRHSRRRLHQVLEVVEHQERVWVARVSPDLGQRAQVIVAGIRTRTGRLADGGQHETRVSQRGELYEEDAPLHGVSQLAGGFLGQTGLSASTRPGQGNEPCAVPDHVLDLSRLALAADQPRARAQSAAGRRARTAWGRPRWRAMAVRSRARSSTEG